MVAQRLRDSGLFAAPTEQGNGTLCFRLRGAEDGASIYVPRNDREFAIRVSALEGNKFPNNESLHAFLRAHRRIISRPSDPFYLVPGRHTEGVIEIIQQGRQVAS